MKRTNHERPDNITGSQMHSAKLGVSKLWFTTQIWLPSVLIKQILLEHSHTQSFVDST